MKALKWVSIIFFLVGVGLLVGGIFSVKNTKQFLAAAVKASGVVERLELDSSRDSDGHYSSTYFPVVQFQTPDGRSISFRSSSGSNPPAFAEGEAVQVLYDPSVPQRAKIDTFMSVWFGNLLLCVMGLLFSGIGGGMLYAAVLQVRKVEWLKQFGQPVQADLIGAEHNTSLEINGVHPYVVAAQWLNPMSGQVHVFRSENLRYDPTPYLTQKTLQVLIDPQNPKRYWMDLSFLPAVAE